MLWPVVSSAACWASSARSVVSSPKKVEMFAIALGLQVQDVVAGGTGGGAGGAVARLGLLAEHPHEVVDEGQLLTHQRAVDAVLARHLVEEAAQLGAALARALGHDRAHQAGHRLERDRGRWHAELGAGAD